MASSSRSESILGASMVIKLDFFPSSVSLKVTSSPERRNQAYRTLSSWRTITWPAGAVMSCPASRRAGGIFSKNSLTVLSVHTKPFSSICFASWWGKWYLIFYRKGRQNATWFWTFGGMAERSGD